MNKKAIPILILPILILVFRPLNIDFNQGMIISSLIITVVSWVIGIPNKIISSIFLLIMFILFGNTPIERILSFPLSSNFLLIILSFVFSQGVINSNLAKKIFLPFINKYSRNSNQFLITMAISVIILVFIIPQPYSRAILMAMVYLEYFDSIKLAKSTREVFILLLFTLNIIVHTFFKRGDIVLNNGILVLAGVQMTELEWIKNLMVPGLGILTLTLLCFIFEFRKELKLFKPGKLDNTRIRLDRDDIINLVLILTIIILWATESIHNINGTTVVIIGTILMYFRKIVNFEDIKSINIEVLFFLTAAFSIGSVMVGSGVSDKIFGRFTNLLPEEFNLIFVLVLVLSSMTLRLFLGSGITTIAVVIPSFITIVGGKVDSMIIMLLLFTSVITFYLFPFHNSLMVLGEGNGYFSTKIVLRFGIYSILIAFVSVFLFYIPWWKLIGLI